MKRRKPIDHEWVGLEEIEEILDVSTAACSYCGGAARVPEDVVAVVTEEDRNTPLVVCLACTPAFTRLLEMSLYKGEDER